jgi:hypothetical protein
MHNDDQPIGRILSRRRALALFGATAAAIAHGARGVSSGGRLLAAAPDCIALPDQTEGPYFVDRALERSDIRRDPATGRTTPGMPLALRFELSHFTPAGPHPLHGASGGGRRRDGRVHIAAVFQR